jgi:HEAT repeat protein
MRYTNYKGTYALDILVQALADSSSSVRQAAVQALGQRPDTASGMYFRMSVSGAEMGYDEE